MGVIKKLKGKELVGWQLNPEVDVYPITHIGAVFNDLNVPLSDILNGLQEQISGGSGGGSSASTYPINYLWAFTTARTDSEALSKLNRSELVDVPTNFVGNTSFTVPDGYYIYMTTARNQGGVYLRWEDNSIWSVPVRIGSGYTTSYTGNDGEGYNYAYCRTNNATPPNIPASLTVVRLEGLSDNQGISASDGSISLTSYNVWYDHPLGVDGTYLWEWIAISRGSDSAGWSAYTGPTLWSKFGVDGRDGDGIEYIFTALAEDAPAPYFINKYNGRIGEQSSDYQEVLIENCTSDSFYQLDDFIPSGWHDTPLILSQSYNKQYVSVRKKHFTNENEGYWGPFSLPVLWAKISSSAITMTLDNDAVLLDDNTSSTSTKIVSCTGIHIWDGDREITTDPNYYIEITASPINSIDDILVLNVVSQIEGNLVYTTDIQDPDYSSGYGYNFTYSVDTFQSSLGMVFCLSRLDELTAMNEGAYAIGYTARIYNSNDRTKPIAEITKTLSVQIVNINDGTSYMMQVSPNSLPVSRVNSTSQYTFTGGRQIDITVKACSGTEVTPCNIYNGNQGEGKLYVTVKAYNAQGPTSVEYASYLSGNGSDIISYRLSDAGNNCLYYIVNLYYVYEGVAYLVETETVDLVIKGDAGENAFYITMTNDSAIADDLTTGALALKNLTLNLLSVYEGSLNITSSNGISITVTALSLPSGLEVVLDANTKGLFYILPTASIGNLLTLGDYWYEVTAWRGVSEPVRIASKIFTFVVRDITVDGTSFKLNITNDVWAYSGTSHLFVGASDISYITVTSIRSNNGRLDVNPLSFELIQDSQLSSYTWDGTGNYPLVVTYPATYANIMRMSNTAKTATAPSTFVLGPIDLKLYYKPSGLNAVLIDSEVIDTRENGKDGKNGESSYTLTLDNDNAIIDDLTVDTAMLLAATETTATLKHGETTLEFGTDYSLLISYLTMPTNMVVIHGNTTTSTNIGTEDDPVALTANKFRFDKNSGATVTNWPLGTYVIVIEALVDGDVVDSRRYKLIIDNISADGSVYKIGIENDVWSYNGNYPYGIIGPSLSKITLFQIGKSNGELIYLKQLFEVQAEGTGGISLTGFTITYPSTLNASINHSSDNKNLTVDTANTTYNASHTTYTFKLYYKGNFTGEAETINCVKNGKDGEGVYFITLDNDTATLDDDTVDPGDIQVATTVHPSFFVGTSDKTYNSATKFYIASLELPDELILRDLNLNPKDAGLQLPYGVFYLALANSGVTNLTQGQYSVTIYVTYNEVRVASKKFTFSITDLSPDGSFYTLTIENDTWSYNGDTRNLLMPIKSYVTVNKITRGTVNSQQFNFRRSPSTNLTNSGLEVLVPNILTYSSDYSGNYIESASSYEESGYTIRLYYNGVLCDSEHIDCIKNGATGPAGATTQGLRGAVVRNRGEWNSNNTKYCYNTDMDGLPPSANNIVYIDIVYHNGSYYQCIKYHSSDSSNEPGLPGSGSYWTVALNFEFIATKVLVADSADMQILSSGSVVVKDNNSDVVGGITGGTIQNTNDVIIWAGDSYQSSSVPVNPLIAPFRVYEDGSFAMANGLFIWEKTGTTNGTTLKYEKSSGNATFGSSWENLTYPTKVASHIILYTKKIDSSTTTTNKIKSLVTAGNAFFLVNSGGSRRIELYAGTESQGTLLVEVNDGNNHWGRLTTTGASSSSDIRLKENFIDFLLTLEQMANSPLFKFNFKGHQDLLQVGTSALYWEPIIPEAISKKYNNRDKNEYLGLNYANVAFAAAISLAKEVKLLKEEVERLKSLLQ